MKINPALCKKVLTKIMKAGLVPSLTSSPGIGKSDIINSIAKDNNLKLIDIRLSQADPSDMMGFPTLNEDRTRSHYAPPAHFPLESDELPTKPDGTQYAGWLMFFDEMNSAAPAVQAASYKIVLDREVGDSKLHKNVWIAAAGNLATDKAIVNRMSTAMQSRLIHLEMEVTLDDWLEWALPAQIDQRIISYLGWKPAMLHRFNPDHDGSTFPCPRTWEFLSRLIDGVKELGPEDTPAITGAIGEGAGLEFKLFLKVYKYLPTLEDLLADPMGVKIPEDPSSIHALTGLISHSATMANFEKLSDVIGRLPKEFQVITIRNTCKKDLSLTQHPQMVEWMQTAANRTQF